MIKEKPITMKGKLAWELKDNTGNIKDSGEVTNTLTELFDAHIAERMCANSTGSIQWMALGSGVGQDASSTDLSNFIEIIALSGASPIQGAGAADNDAIYSAYYAAGEGTNTNITEAGIFRTSGTVRDTLMTYNSGLSINKGASDTLKIDWTVTFGAS